MANSTVSSNSLNPLSMIIHLGKTFKLIGAVYADPRVHWLPKVGFVGAIGLLMAALFFPELGADIVSGALTGGVADAIGIPAEGVIDWMAFSVASWKLLSLFPADVVSEHYNAIFHGK
ncbi:MAG TPA: hypothetical protein VF807_10565 [Ktedonobacterales bacterium]